MARETNQRRNITITDTVWVTLTPMGQEILEAHYGQEPHLDISHHRVIGEYTEFILWELMHIFGPYCDDSFFKDDAIHYEKPFEDT